MRFTCRDTCFHKDIENNFCKKFKQDVTYGKCDKCVLVIQKVAERGGFIRKTNLKTKLSTIITNKEILEQVTKEVMNGSL